MPAPFPADCAARFDPLDLLASGGFGAVYRARDRVLGTDVAARIPGSLSDPGDVARLPVET